MLYVFTDDPKLKKNGKFIACSRTDFSYIDFVAVLANTLSGNIAFNDTFQALSGKLLPVNP